MMVNDLTNASLGDAGTPAEEFRKSIVRGAEFVLGCVQAAHHGHAVTK